MTQKYILRCFLENELGDYCDEFEEDFFDELEGMKLFNRCKFEHLRYVKYQKPKPTYFMEEN